MHPTPAPLHRCKLALADGTVVSGAAIGARGEAGGELCFNTSMTGYQEIITDPSYHGQIMMMTYPHIGNYGAMDIDTEAARPMVAGPVMISLLYVQKRGLNGRGVSQSVTEFPLKG